MAAAREAQPGMSMEVIGLLLLTVITAATPLVYAALGELVVEKSGVLNLGIEGMMLAGAVTGFAAVQATGSGLVGVATGIGAGVLVSLIMALLVLKFYAAQVPSGLALTIFGVGLSALLGQDLVGVAYDG
ncbi:MAG: ABC transporter permease, partial [Pseudomonadota bacterium]|nr:ABC transporter permease [Pseudomonadota bacterium]